MRSVLEHSYRQGDHTWWSHRKQEDVLNFSVFKMLNMAVSWRSQDLCVWVRLCELLHTAQNRVGVKWLTFSSQRVFGTRPTFHCSELLTVCVHKNTSSCFITCVQTCYLTSPPVYKNYTSIKSTDVHASTIYTSTDAVNVFSDVSLLSFSITGFWDLSLSINSSSHTDFSLITFIHTATSQHAQMWSQNKKNICLKVMVPRKWIMRKT